MKRGQKMCLLLFPALVKLASCSISKYNLSKTINVVLSKSTPDSDQDMQFVVGIISTNESNVESSDLLTDWLIHASNKKTFNVLIMSKISRHLKAISLSHTIILMDGFEENLKTLLTPLLHKSTPWSSESRFIFIITKVLSGTLVSSLRVKIKLLWSDVKILNFIVVFMVDFLKDPQILSYNPFKDEILNLTAFENCTIQHFFPNKVANLHGYPLKTSYCLAHPFVYLQDNKLVGVEYDFAKTFLKHINATYTSIRRSKHIDVKSDVISGRVDLASIGLFLFTYSLGHVAYPHGMLDIVALVDRAEPIAALASLVYMFGIDTWCCIFAVLAAACVFKCFFPESVSVALKRRQATGGLKMFLFSLYLFSTIFSLIFLGWITTYLTYPHPGKDINTLDDLIESKLPVYAYSTWKELLTRRLDGQYRYYEKEWVWLQPVDNGPKGAYVARHDYEKSLFKVSQFDKQVNRLRQVQEGLGTSYLIFYIGNKSPYKTRLKNITLRALAYGFNSKEWGGPQAMPSNTLQHASELEMRELEGIFLYFLFGIVLSVLAFVAELFWYYGHRF